jgi:hypothetical protein
LGFVETARGQWERQVWDGRLWEQDEGGGEKEDVDQDRR